MDQHNAAVTERLKRIEEGAERLDHLLRGNGRPGLVTQVAMLDQARADHHAQLAVLTGVPTEIRSLAATVDAERKARLAAMNAEHEARAAATEQLEELVQRMDRAAAVKEGEKLAIDRAGKWLKITTAALAVIGAGGIAGGIRLLDRLSDLLAAIGAG